MLTGRGGQRARMGGCDVEESRSSKLLLQGVDYPASQRTLYPSHFCEQAYASPSDDGIG
jgi:hypothetical protein